MLRKHSWCGALFDSDGHFNMSRRVGDPVDWILRAGEQGAVIELLSDLLVYERTHESNLSVELGTRRMTASMQNAILDVVKTSLDRRRRSVKTFTVKKSLTQREVSYVAT